MHGLDADTSDPEADLLGDGMPTLLRYALGGTPTTPASSLTPRVSFAKADLLFTFNRVADSDLTYEVWASTDLVDWGESPIWSSAGIENTEGEITVAIPLDSPSRFLRMQVLMD